MDVKEIGKKIRKLRESKNMTQEELGNKLFVARKAISKWETGSAIPSIECLTKLSRIFEVTLDELLEPLEENNSNENSVKNIKLSTYDYVFEYKDKKDFSNMELDYSTNKIKITKIEKGEKVTYYKPIIEVQIKIDDENSQAYGLEFTVNADLEFINSLKSKPLNITDRLIEGETILYDPYTKKFGILEIASESKLYSNPAHFWAAKLKDDVLFCKLSVLEENLFLWFKVKLPN